MSAGNARGQTSPRAIDLKVTTPAARLVRALPRRVGQRATLVVLYAVTAVLVCLPLVALLLQGFTETVGDRTVASGRFLTDVAGSAGYWAALGNTLVVAFGATLLASLLGVLLAWIIVRTNVPGRRTLDQLAVLPMFIPPFVGAFAWLLIAAPRIGLLNVPFVAQELGSPFDVYTRAGMVWVMGIYLAPYVFLIVASALRNMDPTLEEAAQISGLSRRQTALSVTLPVIKPAILSGAILAFVVSIGLFGTPVLLGFTKQIYLLTARIYLDLQQFPPAYGVIAIVALYLMALSLLANALQRWALRGRSFVTVSGKNFRPRQIRLGRSRYLLAGVVWSYVSLTAIAPIALIAVAALSTYAWSGRFTLANLEFLWSSNDVHSTLVNTLLITVVSATLATLVGFGVAWVVHRTRLRGRALLDYLILFPISVPSLAFAVGVAFLWVRVPIAVYGTMWVIVLGFLGRYTSYATRSIGGSLVQIHPELEESARVCGYGWSRTLGRITLPLVWPSVVSGWLMLYSIFTTELSIVLPLYTADTRTVSVLSFDTWAVGKFSQVASLSLLQLVIGVGVMYLITSFTRRRDVAV
jgi:iron(III) transport system permease protein